MSEPMTDARLADLRKMPAVTRTGADRTGQVWGHAFAAVCEECLEEIDRLRALLAGLAYDDGDLKATGEWVARRFQEVVAERDAARHAESHTAAVLRCAERDYKARLEQAEAERDALRAELAALRSPAVEDQP